MSQPLVYKLTNKGNHGLFLAATVPSLITGVRRCSCPFCQGHIEEVVVDKLSWVPVYVDPIKDKVLQYAIKNNFKVVTVDGKLILGGQEFA